MHGTSQNVYLDAQDAVQEVSTNEEQSSDGCEEGNDDSEE